MKDTELKLRDNIILDGYPDFIVFFDDQHVQRFTLNFNSSVATNGTPAQATITLVYAEALLEVPYLTDVKIFIKNIFSGRYRMVFDGQIHSRQVGMGPYGKSITYVAYDNLYWLQRIPVPVLLGIEQRLDPVITFSWLSKGINYDKVHHMLTMGAQAFSGMNLADTMAALFSNVNDAMAIHAGAADYDKNTVYHWLKISEKIKIVSDVEATLRDYNPIDILSTGAIIQNMYSFLNTIINTIGYELFQDIDGLVKIKEPFWDEAIIKDHVIDPILVTEFTESTDWDSQFTRVLVTGGVESILENNATDQFGISILTPAGVYIGDTDYFVTTDETFLRNSTPQEQQYVKEPISPTVNATRASIVHAAQSVLGRKYVYGANQPWTIGIDCSGLVHYCYNTAGYPIGRTTSGGYYSIVTRIESNALQAGDLGFHFATEAHHRYVKGEVDHVGIYGGFVNGKHVWYEALPVNDKVPGSGCVMRRVWDRPEGASWQKFGSLLDSISMGYSGNQTLSVPTGNRQEELTQLSPRERRVGINVYEASQPYIRIGLFQGLDDRYRTSAYQQLANYSKYLYKSLNAASDLGSISCIGAPWFRPGTNVWFDPNGLSRVFYLTSVHHNGGPSGVTTSLGLIYGRSEEEYRAAYRERGIDNSFTAVNHISPSEYYKADPASKYPVIVGGSSSNMTAFKTYAEDEVRAKHAGKGSINAYESAYKDWYGAELIRKNTTFLNRWDSEFTLFELYCILASQYKVQTSKTINNYLSTSPSSGPLNPYAGAPRELSALARQAITSDLAAYTPPVITERATKLSKIIVATEQEINGRYPIARSRYPTMKGQ